MADIVLDGVTKQFPGGVRVLEETSLTIHDGELFILVGPSGCGKSTLLNLIVGLEDVSSGEIRVAGRCINDCDPKDRNMAMVFQSYAIYPHMSVRQNIAFPLKIAGLPKPEIEDKVRKAAELLELTELLDRKPSALSGGQRQRVAMGRALVREPVAFLLDEPLSNLDARLRVQMRSEIGRLQKRLATTMIYVTHDQTEAMTLGDRAAVLNGGVIQQIGTPQQLYRQPANLFVAGFIGSPAMNLLPARIEAGMLVLPFGEIRLPQQSGVASRSVVAGFRPEAVSPTAGSEPVDADALIFTITVDALEWLGCEILVYADVCVPRLAPGGVVEPVSSQRVTCIFRIDPDTPVKRAQMLELVLNAGDIHLFDPATGANLSTPD